MTSVFDGQTAVEHAETAAAAIRAISHLTYHDTALPCPSDAWRLIGELASVAYRLRQALEQTAILVCRQQERGLVGVDAGTAYAGDPARQRRGTRSPVSTMHEPLPSGWPARWSKRSNRSPTPTTPARSPTKTTTAVRRRSDDRHHAHQG